MKNIQPNDLKKIQLKILKKVADFCDENGITYFLDFGTLIGAVRHKGYIPWDDDIDVSMPREDYDKFTKLFNESNKNSNIRFVNLELDSNFFLPYGKAIDLDTILYEPDEKGFKTSVNIDIFPYDNISEDPKELEKFIKLRSRYYFLHGMRNYRYTGSIVKLIVANIIKLPLLILPRNYFIKKINKLGKKYAGKDCKKTMSCMEQYSIVSDKENLIEMIDWDFEGYKFKIPKEYDKWLKNIYGDYMQLPPECERISHHSYVAYYANEENREEN